RRWSRPKSSPPTSRNYCITARTRNRRARSGRTRSLPALSRNPEASRRRSRRNQRRRGKHDQRELRANRFDGGEETYRWNLGDVVDESRRKHRGFLQASHPLSDEDHRQRVEQDRSRRKERTQRHSIGGLAEHPERQHQKRRRGNDPCEDGIALDGFGRSGRERLEEYYRLAAFSDHGEKGGGAKRERRHRAPPRALHLVRDELVPSVSLILGRKPRTHVEKRCRREELKQALDGVGGVIADEMIDHVGYRHAGQHAHDGAGVDVARAVGAIQAAGARRESDNHEHRLQAFPKENSERVEEVRNGGVVHFENDSQ